MTGIYTVVAYDRDGKITARETIFRYSSPYRHCAIRHQLRNNLVVGDVTTGKGVPPVVVGIRMPPLSENVL